MIGVHSRSVSPASCGFDSHSATAHALEALHTTLDVAVALRATNSLAPHVLCALHLVFVCCINLWNVPGWQAAHLFLVASRYFPTLHTTSAVVVVVAVFVDVVITSVVVDVVIFVLVLVVVDAVVVVVVVPVVEVAVVLAVVVVVSVVVEVVPVVVVIVVLVAVEVVPVVVVDVVSSQVWQIVPSS